MTDKNDHLQPVNVLGLPFHPVKLSEAAELVEEAIEKKQRYFISTPNLNFTVMAQQDKDFYHSVLASDLVVADGMPLIWVAKFLGLPITERVAGSDLFDLLSKQPREKKLRVFFFGGEKGIAEKAYHALNINSVGMTACGFYDPGFVSVDEMSHPDIIQRINRTQPDFIVVALGAKKGQQWIMRNQNTLNAPVISHLGAVINFVAGHIDRAPEKWQKLGLEWIWRIKQEPKLYKRYLFDGFSFLRMLATEVLPLKLVSYSRKSKSGTADFEVKVDPKSAQRLYVKGELTQSYLIELDMEFSALLSNPAGDVMLFDQGVTFIDSVVIARLSQFQAALSKQGRQLYFQNASHKLKRVLKFNSVSKHFKLI